MFCVGHVFIHTFVKGILGMVCIEKIDIFCVSLVLIHTWAKLILAQDCMQ